MNPAFQGPSLIVFLVWFFLTLRWNVACESNHQYGILTPDLMVTHCSPRLSLTAHCHLQFITVASQVALDRIPLLYHTKLAICVLACTPASGCNIIPHTHTLYVMYRKGFSMPASDGSSMRCAGVIKGEWKQVERNTLQQTGTQLWARLGSNRLLKAHKTCAIQKHRACQPAQLRETGRQGRQWIRRWDRERTFEKGRGRRKKQLVPLGSWCKGISRLREAECTRPGIS